MKERIMLFAVILFICSCADKEQTNTNPMPIEHEIYLLPVNHTAGFEDQVAVLLIFDTLDVLQEDTILYLNSRDAPIGGAVVGLLPEDDYHFDFSLRELETPNVPWWTRTGCLHLNISTEIVLCQIDWNIGFVWISFEPTDCWVFDDSPPTK